MAEKETITISLDMGNKIINYLVNRPYREVNNLVPEFLSELNSRQESTTGDIIKEYERGKNGE
mgnify:CR=1 FL=1